MPCEDQCRRAHHPRHPTLQNQSNQIFLAGFRALVSAIPLRICIIRKSVHGIIVYGWQHLNSESDKLRVNETQTSSLITLDCPDASGNVASHLAAASKSADGIRGCAGLGPNSVMPVMKKVKSSSGHSASVPGELDAKGKGNAI